jgi:hypothetical protein
MHRILALIFLAALLLAGCSTDDTNNSGTNPQPGQGIFIVWPPADTTFEVACHWDQLPSHYHSRCRWGFRMDSAVFSVRATANLPFGVSNAQVFVGDGRFGSTLNFWNYGDTVSVRQNTFSLPFYRIWDGWTSDVRDNTMKWAVFVRVKSIDGSYWSSPVVFVNIAFRGAPCPEAPPEAPFADTVLINQSSQPVFSWCDRSACTDSFRVSCRSEAEPVVQTTTLYESYYRQWYGYHYLPRTRYWFWVQSKNQYGISVPSDTLTALTGEPDLPYDLRTNGVDSSVVYLHWQNATTFDSLLVARRDITHDWEIIQTLQMYSSYLSDETVTAGTTYYYKLGAWYPNGTWWSMDSLKVTTP